MKKNIIIIILVVTNIISLVYVFAQYTIANHAMEEAIEHKQLAKMNAIVAKVNADSARVATERARQQRLIAEKIMVDLQNAKIALADCK